MNNLLEKFSLPELIAVTGLCVGLVASVITNNYDITQIIGAGLIGYIGGKKAGS